MDKHELALKVASDWIKVLGGPLRDKSISIVFESGGYFPDDWTIAAWKLPFRTRRNLPKAVAHLKRDGKFIPEKEVREVILRNAFDSLELTIFQVPEEQTIPKWVEEEYFVRGILRALLRLRYPDWNEHQLIDYEEKLVGKKGLRRASLPKAALYTCQLVLTTFLINLGVFWVLNGYTIEGNLAGLYIAVMVEGLFLAALGLTLTEVYDTTIYSPTGRTFFEHVRFPPRPTAAIALMASGLLLFLLGLFLLP